MGLHSNSQLDDVWDKAYADSQHSDIVTDFFRCQTEYALRATIEFVRYLNFRGLDKDNYPFYMSLFLHKNKKVIQAFLGDGNILKSLLSMPRNTQLVGLCVELLRRYKPKEVYEKILETLFQILRLNYKNSYSGFQVYPLTGNHLNHFGKFLDKTKPQSYRLNRFILDLLADIGDLGFKEINNEEYTEVSAYANKIRNVFFDQRMSMREIIPTTILQ